MLSKGPVEQALEKRIKRLEGIVASLLWIVHDTAGPSFCGDLRGLIKEIPESESHYEKDIQ